MSDTSDTSDTNDTNELVEPVEIVPSRPGPVKRHPIRGASWGLVMGIGASMILIGRAVLALGTVAPLLVIVVFMVLGVAWAYLAPARG